MKSSDFNISPDDPAYAILLGSPLTEGQRSVLNASLVIHATVDPSIERVYEKRPIDIDSDEEEEGDGQAQTTGQAQTEAQKQSASGLFPNTRRAELRDGLLSEQELRAMARFAYLGTSMRVHDLTGVSDLHR
jgi:RNA exonuclease NGL2